jgi:hypothetical protein
VRNADAGKRIRRYPAVIEMELAQRRWNNQG